MIRRHFDITAERIFCFECEDKLVYDVNKEIDVDDVVLMLEIIGNVGNSVLRDA
jgi:hypothetical protein